MAASAEPDLESFYSGRYIPVGSFWFFSTFLQEYTQKDKENAISRAKSRNNINFNSKLHSGFPGGGKEFSCQCRRCERCGLDPWVQKIIWSRKWQPTPVFLPGKFHGQSLEGYSPWDHKELDTTEQLSPHTQTACTCDQNQLRQKWSTKKL